MNFPLAPIKIIFALFALFAWSRALLRFRSKAVNIKELIFWTLLWSLAIIAVFIPGKTTLLAKILGMERGFDAMIFIAVIGLFYATYRLYVMMNEFEREVTELVRKIALNKIHGVRRGRKGKKVTK